ncbi:sigma-54-dependent Fis family transcriptional regulator [Rhodococcus sp. T7]|uniref:sigma-54-dependent Fis family transcriptional regulator n=1 Tax=Rhodococcus sp. T7 TaxID=627444 RepID=UPI0013C58CFF|nr:helix-turn-helix domain-containing protein [Rhodococcus sp. T7]KAF0957121.1 hypothetical protein MLGJGCBP_08951 [Rhodococcus sp. T7]KAF0958846.1 hypothetical protein MLGJGCBP_08040 [Rhodococcus sp. T7]
MLALDDSREFYAAREAFLSDGLVPPAGVVRPVIFDSWHRSKLYGLDANGVNGVRVVGGSLEDRQLVRASKPLVDRYRAGMWDFPSALMFTDEVGTILEHRVNDPKFARRLDARNIAPGFSLAENSVGTCAAGISLETGKNALVLGAEHFPTSGSSLASASAVIHHPITHRMIGTVALSCAVREASPLMLSWLEDQADKIERSILDSASAREQQLLTAFMSESHDIRNPVICLNERTVISNAAAARLIANVDQTLLWELAAESVRLGRSGSFEVMLPDSGTLVEVHCKPIARGDDVVGATLRLKNGPSRSTQLKVSCPPLSPRESVILPRLAGQSIAWLEFCRQLRLALDDRKAILLIGGPGSGKTSVLTELARTYQSDGEVALIDLDPTSDHREQIASALTGAGPIIVDNLHMCRGFGVRQLSDVLRGTSSSAQVIAAMLWNDSSDGCLSADDFGVWPGVVIQIPQLKDRIGDLPLLLDSLTSKRVASGMRPVWTAEAVQTLGRVAWSANVASLAKIVTSMIRRHAGPYIRRDDLPSEVLALAGRRPLYGLEYSEVQAIIQALKASDGNKSLAAEKLGIARSTLYRKVRALGIDLSGSTY